MAKRPPADGRVLLIEHDEDGRAMAIGVLGRLGYLVDVASDGAQALDLAESRSYLAVFISCDLPVLDGYEVARQWRARGKGARPGPPPPIPAATRPPRPPARGWGPPPGPRPAQPTPLA